MNLTMEDELKVEVISKEMVKPSLPPSSHPQTFTLSLLDQIFPAFHMPTLLFYKPLGGGGGGGGAIDIIISRLKESLSQTLDQFYPLAGRFSDESTVCCNDHGVPFFVTKVNCPLSDVLGSPQKLKLLPKFLPPQELQALGPRPISEVVPLSIQINVFLCGGVVIGFFALHKLADALSSGSLLKHWSAVASKREDGSLIKPDYEAAIKAFPPLPQGGVDHVFVPNLCQDTDHFVVVVKSFRFSPEAVSRLRAKAASDQVPRPSRFEALAGFVWEQVVLAAQNKQTELSISVDMRSRMNPPLPKESIGNIITNAKTQTDTTRCSLQELVKDIRSALSAINHRITTVYQGHNGGQILRREREAESQGVLKQDKGCKYQLSSLCGVGFNQADFGFGKPSWIVPIDGRPIPPSLRNFISFTDYYNSAAENSGIEAWLFLEENEMHALESNPLFLAFASPY